jgi:hypothetical protein
MALSQAPSTRQPLQTKSTGGHRGGWYDEWRALRRRTDRTWQSRSLAPEVPRLDARLGGAVQLASGLPEVGLPRPV